MRTNSKVSGDYAQTKPSTTQAQLCLVEVSSARQVV